MRLIYSSGIYILECSFEQRHIPREAKFKFDGTTKKWFTDNCQIAARFRDFADEPTKRKLSQDSFLELPWAGAIRLPTGEKFMPHQNMLVEFNMTRNKAYDAADPGTGKSPVAVKTADILKQKTLAIVPPFMKITMAREFNRWAENLRDVSIIDSKTKAYDFSKDVVIMPDSLVEREEIRQKIFKANFKTLIIDEAHRYKTMTAKRTQSLFGVKPKDAKAVRGIVQGPEKVICLSGTPMPNGRPLELFPVLNALAPNLIDGMNMFEYGLEYCGGYRTDFGWDFTGASNVDKLNSKIQGTFMKRVSKKEVLTDLPDKIEQIILLNNNLGKKIRSFESDFLSNHEKTDLSKAISSLGLGELATWRQEIGLAKVDEAVKFIESLTDDPNEAVLVFAHHKSVVSGLKQGLAKHNPFVLTGDTKSEDKQKFVDQFQNGERSRIFIGNIDACGVGLTLTRASRVVFVEFDWTPSDNEQAADRAHRITQTKNVYVQYLVISGSLDEYILDAIFRKTKVINKFLKGGIS